VRRSTTAPRHELPGQSMTSGYDPPLALTRRLTPARSVGNECSRDLIAGWWMIRPAQTVVVGVDEERSTRPQIHHLLPPIRNIVACHPTLQDQHCLALRRTCRLFKGKGVQPRTFVLVLAKDRLHAFKVSPYGVRESGHGQAWHCALEAVRRRRTLTLSGHFSYHVGM